jgi:hypothetical protein
MLDPDISDGNPNDALLESVNPITAPQCHESLSNGFVQGFCGYFDRVSYTLQVLDRDAAGSDGHKTHRSIFRLSFAILNPVPRQNSIRAENSAIPCRDNLKRKPGWGLRARRLSPGVNTRAGSVLCKDGGTRTFSRRYVASD